MEHVEKCLPETETERPCEILPGWRLRIREYVRGLYLDVFGPCLDAGDAHDETRQDRFRGNPIAVVVR